MVKHTQETHNTLRVLRAAPRAPAVKTASSCIITGASSRKITGKDRMESSNVYSRSLAICGCEQCLPFWINVGIHIKTSKGKARQSAKRMTGSLVLCVLSFPGPSMLSRAFTHNEQISSIFKQLVALQICKHWIKIMGQTKIWRMKMDEIRCLS